VSAAVVLFVVAAASVVLGFVGEAEGGAGVVALLGPVDFGELGWVLLRVLPEVLLVEELLEEMVAGIIAALIDTGPSAADDSMTEAVGGTSFGPPTMVSREAVEVMVAVTIVVPVGEIEPVTTFEQTEKTPPDSQQVSSALMQPVPHCF
jgi:hypothetical protein